MLICRTSAGPIWRRYVGQLALSFHQHLFDLGDGLGRVEAFRAGCRTVHDRVTAIKAEGVLEVIESFALVVVTAIREPAIGL